MKVQSKYLELLKKKGKEVGLTFDENLILENKHCYASAIFQKELLKYEENKEIMKNNNISLEPDFYRAEQCNKDSIFYIDENIDLIDLKDILKIIHQAGGVTFLAHPYRYNIDNIGEMVEYIARNYDIDGIECYYSTFTEEQIYNMLKYTQKYNLYISGGTDFHGQRKPDISLGVGKGNLKINKSVIQNWINKTITKKKG